MKKSLAALALIPFLMLGKPAIAQEQKPKQPLEIILNYEAGSKENEINYGQSSYYYSHDYLYSFQDDYSSKLTEQEKSEIAEIINDIKYKKIDSYSDLVNYSKPFSESQKLAFLATISDLLYNGMYDYNLPSNPVSSQDNFFINLQNYLETEKKENFGVCRHFSTYIEKMAKDLGLRAASVTGFDHVYTLIKTEDQKSAIVDGGKILVTNSKNIEKLLEAYQKNKNSIAFNHFFFEDSKLKYYLITENGKNFLDFIGYDESTDTIKNYLMLKNKINSEKRILFNKTDSELSAEFDFSGAFGKFGEFYGNSLFPSQHLILQAGYKKDFLVSGLYLNPEISFMYALPSNSFSKDVPFFGIEGSFLTSTANEKGINLSARLSGNVFMKEDLQADIANLFKSQTWGKVILSDVQFQAGTSYLFLLDKFEIKPYIISKFNLFPTDIGTYSYSPILSEINAGIGLGINLNDTQFSFSPYYAKRIWEQEFGTNVESKIKNFGFSIGGYVTKSNYDFCPDKMGLSAELSANLCNIGIKACYKTNIQNYDGETSNNPSFSITGRLKF